MKRILPVLLSLLLLTGCVGNSADGYQQITQEEAKEMMDTQEVIILDVREQDEYNSGHIPGAVLLPVGSIDEDTAAEVIPPAYPAPSPHGYNPAIPTASHVSPRSIRTGDELRVSTPVITASGFANPRSA